MKTPLQIISIVLAVLCVSQDASPQTGVSSRSLDFARSLILEGEYYRAITEFKRELFYASPDDLSFRADAIMGIGEAYYAGREFERCGEWVYAHLGDLQAASRDRDGAILMCRAYLDAGAGNRLLNILETAPNVPVSETEYYRPLALANVRRWADAREAFSRVASGDPYKSTADDHARIAQRAADASWKRPAVAGWLAILPGAGYLYADHWQTGIAALLVNLAFFGATYQAFDSDMPFLGGFLALVSASWYGSSIYGSTEAVRRYNDRLQDDFWSELRY
ncbi:MAG: hypothetical protein JSW58_16165 [Candidatus Latescibacterota bacterium]|nr:MAG: hypothetical protein JSW58_16165 [Candidatus Latescibacterota bacterium]